MSTHASNECQKDQKLKETTFWALFHMTQTSHKAKFHFTGYKTIYESENCLPLGST